MKTKILYVERKPNEYVSIEKAFRQIAEGLSEEFESEFQQTPFGNSLQDIFKNLIFFRKKKAEIYHITGHIHYLALLFPPARTVLSIMDVRFLYRPKGLRRWVLKKLFLDWPVKRMKYITAISEATKSEIVFFTGCDERKIRVLELPLRKHFGGGRKTYNWKKDFQAARPVILQVGTMPNKNIPNLAKALRGINCRLQIIGRIDAGLQNVLEENEIDYENRFDLDDKQLREAFQNSDLVAFCSTYEGFGLPVIEAQALGKPVVTSRISPLQEVAGGGAALVDPLNISSIREGILKIIENAGYRKEVVARGLENVKRFAPEIISEGYERLYREILSKY